MSERANPRFRDAYLVEDADGTRTPVGVARKEGNVWAVLQFGVPVDRQPRDVFATRGAAGQKLVELARAGN